MNCPRIVRIGVVVVAGLSLLAAGCGGGDDSSTTAQEAVCTNAASLERAIDELIDDINNLDLGSAEDQLSNVADAATALAGSVETLGGQARGAIEREIDELQASLDDLTSASSIDDIRDTIDRAESQVQGVFDAVADALTCNA